MKLVPARFVPHLFLALPVSLAVLAGACANADTGATADGDAGTTTAGKDGGKSSSASGDSGTSAKKPADGKDLVTQLDCGSCHTGKAGELAGNDSPVKGTQQYAPNLTPDKDTGIGDWTDEQIATAITTGEDDEQAELCEKMPRFKDLSNDEVAAIVKYLRSLKPVSHAAPESICPPLKTGEPDDAGVVDDASTTVTDASTTVVDASVPVDGGSSDGGSCSDYADPTTTAGCHCNPSLHTCAANGCYGGYVCQTTTNKCKASKPAGCP